MKSNPRGRQNKSTFYGLWTYYSDSYIFQFSSCMLLMEPTWKLPLSFEFQMCFSPVKKVWLPVDLRSSGRWVSWWRSEPAWTGWPDASGVFTWQWHIWSEFSISWTQPYFWLCSWAKTYCMMALLIWTNNTKAAVSPQDNYYSHNHKRSRKQRPVKLTATR